VLESPRLNLGVGHEMGRLEGSKREGELMVKQ
jgi:hypothetical protein